MNQNYYQQGPNTPSDSTSIACMILGICSIVFCFCYGIVGIVCGVIALVLYGKVKQANNGYVNGNAKAGFICGIVGTVISTLFLIYVIIVFTLYGSMLSLLNL